MCSQEQTRLKLHQAEGSVQAALLMWGVWAAGWPSGDTASCLFPLHLLCGTRDGISLSSNQSPALNAQVLNSHQ